MSDRERRRITSRYSFPERLFTIYDSAAAGSRWVAMALNLAGGVLCTHAPQMKLVRLLGRTFGEDHEATREAPRMDPVEMLCMVEAVAYHRLAAGMSCGMIAEQDDRLVEHFGPRLRRAVLVRDPIRRVDSIVHDRLSADPEARALPVPIEPLMELHGGGAFQDATPEQRAFIYGCWQVSAIDPVLDQPEIRIFRFEDLLSDHDADCALLAHLTDGLVRDWHGEERERLEALRGRRVGVHTGERRQGIDVYRGWADWKRAAFARFVSPPALEWYTSAGYELDGVVLEGHEHITKARLRALAATGG
jgi:hypothetical protein